LGSSSLGEREGGWEGFYGSFTKKTLETVATMAMVETMMAGRRIANRMPPSSAFSFVFESVWTMAKEGAREGDEVGLRVGEDVYAMITGSLVPQEAEAAVTITVEEVSSKCICSSSAH
jgi:hypothetical protein